jgi:hypothetical protein
METKAMTLRLPADQAAEFEAVARADNMSVSEAARAALADRIEARRKDKEFQARLKKMVEQDALVLKRLAQ